MSGDLEKSTWPSSSPRLEEWAVESLFAELDTDKGGFVQRQAIVDRLLQVYTELTPSPKPYHLIYPSRVDDLNTFISQLFARSDATQYSRQQFGDLVRGWQLPSVRVDEPVQVTPAVKETTFLQRMRTRWSTKGHRYLFILAVLCLQIGVALWQLIAFLHNDLAREAFGTGMLVAKAAAGALYPTLTLMVLAMSRWLQNFLRRSQVLRRYVDWEHARIFHIQMACIAFALGLTHGIAHMTGTYRHALTHRTALEKQIWQRPGTPVPWSYPDFLKWRASWTGLTALACFTFMTITGSPSIRKRFFELFQWSHLLMYPLFTMLLIHGSSAILKKPMLGWWLLVPIALVLTEKVYRLVRGFIRMEARVLLVEDDMVALSIEVGRNVTQYRPGQYVLLQVAAISRTQWHPFTVSTIIGDRITLHIRTSAGDWTAALQDLARRETQFGAALDGPYGSPSREFYQYDRTIILGAGIGITPFSAILYDLSDKLRDNQSPWKRDARDLLTFGANRPLSVFSDRLSTDQIETTASSEHRTSRSFDMLPPPIAQLQTPSRTLRRGPKRSPSAEQSLAMVDECHLAYLKTVLQKRSISLHWTVRNSQDLQWLSSLLNKLTPDLSVKVNVQLYITRPAKDERISTIIFRSLLDHCRIEEMQSTSFLTGLHHTCHFRRPDFDAILDRHHTDLRRHQALESPPTKIGVIYCGPASLGRLLERRCEVLTGRSRVDGTRIRYSYHSESY